ncbi:MAG: 30S ribosomal protein S2, partial [Novosphingobium sp.]
ANDDASRAIRLYCEAVAAAATKGGRDAAIASGADLGAMAEPLAEEATAEA